ncbi:MAG: 30S ribosomal protein S9, partial [Verrucomicrobiae bacterium]|nr:30S ribosomal protein S9 [Verrucomicrobiae bacterium]
MSTATDFTSATGRRKTAVARVSLKPGSGSITINERS